MFKNALNKGQLYFNVMFASKRHVIFIHTIKGAQSFKPFFVDGDGAERRKQRIIFRNADAFDGRAMGGAKQDDFFNFIGIRFNGFIGIARNCARVHIARMRRYNCFGTHFGRRGGVHYIIDHGR